MVRLASPLTGRARAIILIKSEGVPAYKTNSLPLAKCYSSSEPGLRAGVDKI